MMSSLWSDLEYVNISEDIKDTSGHGNVGEYLADAAS